MAALSMLILTGCKKEKFDPTKPIVTWETNAGFSTQELTATLDAKVKVAAPGKIGELNLVMGLGQYNILANQHIQIQANKGTASSNPVLDLIGDASSVSFAKSLGLQAGPALKEKEEVVLDLKAILEEIIKGQVIDDNTTLSVEIKVKDQTGQAYSRTARFHFTEAPRFSWAKNQSFLEVDLDATPIECKVALLASGVIDKLTVKLEEGAAPFLTSYVKNRVTDGGTLLDLAGNNLKPDAFSGAFPTGSSVQGKKQATLDFAFLYGLKFDMEASTNVFTIKAVDKNGKETVQQVKFVKR